MSTTDPRHYDVIYAFVDAGLAGVTDAVAESGGEVKLIGYIVPHCDAGDAFIADAIFDSVVLYQQIGQSVLDGTWAGGGQTFVGLENPDVVRLDACDVPSGLHPCPEDGAPRGRRRGAADGPGVEGPRRNDRAPRGHLGQGAGKALRPWAGTWSYRMC